jgi:hypothetical protein
MSAIETASTRATWRATDTEPWISEDWLSVVIGLVIFMLALAVLANVDLIGWVVTTSVWSNLGQALGTASKTYAGLGGVGALLATYAALLAVLSAAAVALKRRREKIRARLHGGVLDRLCQLDRRQLRQFRRGHAGRTAKVRHQLVAAFDQ